MVANHRNKLEEDLIDILKVATENGKVEVANSEQQEELKDYDLKIIELTNNFMSSEFLKLSIDILEISCEQKLNINIQYQATESCKALFKFSSHLIYRVPNYSEIIYDNLELLTTNYLLEVKEIIKSLNSDYFAVREMSLICLDHLNVERESCQSKIDASERFILGNYDTNFVFD